MRVRGKGAVLIGAEGNSPPLPFIEVEDSEGQALIGMGVAEVVADEAADNQAAEWAEAEAKARDEAAAEEAERQRVAAEAEAEAARVAGAEAEATRAAEAEEARLAAEAAANAGTDSTGADEGEADADARASLIAEALDLIEPEHLVKTGDRAGKPKVSAMEEISGLTDLTADEIDAAFAAREAADA